MKVSRAAAIVLAAALSLLLAGCQTDRVQAVSSSPSAPAALREVVQPLTPVAPVARQPARPRPAAAPALLQAANGGDGDSWHDTQGTEYRLGLINTPEAGECYGSTATAKRKQLTAAGFRASVYATDSYGRSVSVVTLPDGRNLNLWLARHGYANDTYLAQFRHENPSLALQLDGAFAAAKREKVGLWRACAARAAPQPLVQQPAVTSTCHPDYLTCIPIKGDGSGAGSANDLDCPDIGEKVTLRQGGVDPYRLDSDGDGYGCDSY